MNWNHVHRAAACAVFFTAAALYGTTVSPTAVLWDSGEFIASAVYLQVMHPPGAPLFILLGRLFAIVGGTGHAALAVNFVSVLAASTTAVFAYLIIVRLVRGWSSAASIGGGLIGALTLVASDSFWFNAVEAEVYALATLFIAAIVWLTLRWSDEARRGRNPVGAHRYLVLIFFLFGLSIGIHLMSILTYFFLLPVAFFTLANPAEWTTGKRSRWLLAGAALGVVGFAVIYPGIVIMLPDAAGRIGSPTVVGAALVLLIVGGLVYTHRRRLMSANLALLSLASVLLGYSSFLLIPIRSATDPFIDLNDPETTEAFVSYVKREQYGSVPLLRGASYDNRSGMIDRDREVFLPRRHSEQPQHLALYGRYESDWDYFWRYQMGHMYGRYILWNFAGRAHDVQHARWITGFEDADALPYPYDTPSERASRNLYFALPLLLGIFGLITHFGLDRQRALSLLALFLVTGAGLVIYLNEIPATPRERDYVYVGSYFVFCLWIGLGAARLIRWMASFGWMRTVAQRAAFIVLALALPGWMGIQNFDDHDRSGNFVARDYAYNLLMSVDENAVLFTGGDNDTYPLWYLQSVEGVRRDVRVVCLPLLQTSWYAKQLKNQWAYQSPPLPISFTNEQLDRLQPASWQPRELALAVDEAALLEHPELKIAVEDTNGFEQPMRWKLEGRPFRDDFAVLFSADQVILDVLATNAREGWKRPIYFASTTAPSDRLNLDAYLQREGLALRVVPIRHGFARGRVVPGIMTSRLEQFRFTNLGNKDVYFADDVRSMSGFHYRLTYSHAADTLIDHDRPDEAKKLMDVIMEEVPPDTIPLHSYQGISLGQTCLRMGDTGRVVELMSVVRPRLLRELRFASNESDLRGGLQFAQAVRSLLIGAGAYDEASVFSAELARLLGDDSIEQSAEELRSLYGGPSSS